MTDRQDQAGKVVVAVASTLLVASLVASFVYLLVALA